MTRCSPGTRGSTAWGYGRGMRLRDHDKGDLALTALALTVAAAAAVSETARWLARRRATRQGHRGTGAL